MRSGRRISFPAARAAYSTFSTYEWETLSTIRSGAFLEASLYAFSSLFLGLVGVCVGILIAEIIS